MDKKSFLLGTLTGVMTRGQILSHTKMRNSTLLYRRVYFGSPTARHLNENLKNNL